MNPQALPPYPRDPVSNSKFASWDYPIGNIERWHAKTSLDQHYAAGKLQPTEYETRMVGIMGATMWSHLVAIFADLPAPGPAYDGKQLLKACHAAQKAQSMSPLVTILLPIGRYFPHQSGRCWSFRIRIFHADLNRATYCNFYGYCG